MHRRCVNAIQFRDDPPLNLAVEVRARQWRGNKKRNGLLIDAMFQYKLLF